MVRQEVVFCNDKCLCMRTYVEHMWSIVGWIHSKHRNRLAQPTVEKAVRDHGNLVLRKAMMERNKNVVVWDSQTAITEPDRYTDEQGADDVDEEDSADEK